jgi:hypothetical protein
VYEHMFHGPGFQVLGGFHHGGPRPEAAMGELGEASRLAPRGLFRLAELGMQTAGMWLLRSSGLAALPASIDAIHVMRVPAAAGPYHAVSVYRGKEDHGVEGVHHRFDVTIRNGSSGTVVWMEGLALVETGSRPEAVPGARPGASSRSVRAN